jgi:hypothetical protein
MKLIILVALIPSLFSSSISYASRIVYKSEKIESNGKIEIVDPEIEKASEEVQKTIQEYNGVLLNLRKSVDKDNKPHRLHEFTIRFNTEKVESALARLRKIGTITNETSTLEMSRETLNITVELTDSRRRSRPSKVAQLFAGAAAAAVNLSLSDNFNRSMLGGGISLTPSGKWAYLTILSLRGNSDANDTQGPSSSGSTMILVGHNYYSSIFGSGENTFLNPFAGVNYGIARLYNRSFLAVGGTLGVELLNTEWITISAAAKLTSLYNAKDGGTAAIYLAQMSLPF